MSQVGDNFKKRSVRSKPELPKDLISLPEAPVRRNRKSKSERLRELTEKLKQSSLAEGSVCDGSKVTVSNDESNIAGTQLLDPDVNLTLQRPTARTIVGAYIQRTIPFRSASFSQVDVGANGKYIRSARQNPTSSNSQRDESTGSMTLPRQKPSNVMSSTHSLPRPPIMRCAALTEEEIVKDPPVETLHCDPTNFIDSLQNSALPPPIPHTSSSGRRKVALYRSEWKSEPTHSLGTQTCEEISVSNNGVSAKKEAVSDMENDRLCSSEEDDDDDCSPSRVTGSSCELLTSRRRTRRRRKDYHELSCETPSPRLLTYNAIVTTPVSTSIETPLLDQLTKNSRPSLNQSASFDDSTNLIENEFPVVNSNHKHFCEPQNTLCDLPSNVNLTHEKVFDSCKTKVNFDAISESHDLSSSDITWCKADAAGSPDIRIESTTSGDGTGGEWCWDTTGALSNETRAVTPQSDSGGGGSCHRLAPLLRNDSLSEGESDSSSRRSGAAHAASCGTSPNSPRRYNKRPLRGPYGQMLEAEMKRASPAKLLPRELGFLESIQQTSPQPQPRRKTSAYQMSETGGSSGSGLTSGSTPPGPTTHVHQRAASSPCQLIGLEEHERSKDTRTHVVVELYETEKSYVEALRTLVTKYLNPLKSSENPGLVEASVVDEIFFQVPSILKHHEGFLEDLHKRLDSWNLRQRVGDIFLEVFTRQAVIDCYTAFINNWQQAKSAIRNTCQSKPAFARFLEAMSREHKGKLALDSLLIMPVQRIPRYELLIQTLLKHTTSSHPDYSFLVSAQRAIHALAVTINCREKESCEAEHQLQQLKELESLLDGAGRLASPDRNFIRHDSVTATVGGTSKDRMLFLFSDMLLIASVKRRSGTIRKPSTSGMTGVTSNLEANKYKTLMKFSLSDLEIVKARDETVRRLLQELAEVSEDCNLVARLLELSSSLHCSHVSLDECLRDMQTSLSRQLTEKQSGDNGLNCLELSLGTQGETMSLVFGKPELRASWEEVFTESKHKLALSAERRPSPEFLSPLAIRKTRAGLQFTCATATLGPSTGHNNKHSPRDVWVCNSDGYVGQVCVLSLQNEPTVTSCNGVCNARILCIAAIPVLTPSISNSNASENYDAVSCRKNIDDEDLRRRNMQFESSSSSSDDDDLDDGGDTNLDLSHYSQSGGQDDSLEDLDTASQPTMWLGTEDGYIHVYNSTDNIRIKKNKIRIHHGSAVHCIIYMDNRVFVALANGDITVYIRDGNHQWNTTEPCCVQVGTPAAPVIRMVRVGDNHIWCGCQNTIRVLNTTTLQVEGSFAVGSESDRPIHCLTCSDSAVWISLYNSANIRLYHGTTLESLCDVNVAPAVTKMLSSCDDIIRQHKAACLRVTALLACQDLLWVGTSAGVILTVPIPHLSVTTSKLPANPAVIGIPHGHTGHVRFLTSVQMEPEKPTNIAGSNDGANSSSQQTGKILVISGGDGYEDFRSSSLSEIAGREDSTNHLLLWRV